MHIKSLKRCVPRKMSSEIHHEIYSVAKNAWVAPPGEHRWRHLSNREVHLDIQRDRYCNNCNNGVYRTLQMTRTALINIKQNADFYTKYFIQAHYLIISQLKSARTPLKRRPRGDNDPLPNTTHFYTLPLTHKKYNILHTVIYYNTIPNTDDFTLKSMIPSSNHANQ